jgi:hypothetical protein
MRGMSTSSDYCKQAEELRAAARATKDKVTRKTLLKLAEEFDRMAAYPATNHPKELPKIHGRA